jgi:hypothetical protein
MKKRMTFRGQQLLNSEGHLEMAAAYEKAANDSRLTPKKRLEYLKKAEESRELAAVTKSLKLATPGRENGRKRATR